MRLIGVFMLLLGCSMGFAQSSKDLDKKELAMLAGLEKTQVAAKAKFKKNPKDAKVKTAYVAATLKYADAVEISPALGPKVKYPKSLNLYREVRKVDPKNEHAIKHITTTESIYKSMGRPIPPN